jgi:hypothetical protein
MKIVTMIRNISSLALLILIIIANVIHENDWTGIPISLTVLTFVGCNYLIYWKKESLVIDAAKPQEDSRKNGLWTRAGLFIGNLIRAQIKRKDSSS